MEERVRHAALHPVAKIALGTGWLAFAGNCGGRFEFASPVPDESGTPIASGYGGPGAASDASPGPVGDTSTAMPEAASGMAPGVDRSDEGGLACLSPIAIDSSISLVSDAELACCTAYVAAHPSRVVDGGMQDPALVNCCKAVIVRAAPNSGVRNACCFGLILGPPASLWALSNQYCAPWGPPVPPALDWSAEAAA